MTASVIDMLARPLVFARVTTSALTAATLTLADGHAVGFWHSGVLLRKQADGRRMRFLCFPQHLIIDLPQDPEERDKDDDTVQRTITLNHFMVVESRFDNLLVLEWME